MSEHKSALFQLSQDLPGRRKIHFGSVLKEAPSDSVISSVEEGGSQSVVPGPRCHPITWELTRNVSHQAPPLLTESETLGWAQHAFQVILVTHKSLRSPGLEHSMKYNSVPGLMS